MPKLRRVNKISRKLLTRILLFSSLVTLILTVAQLSLEYKEGALRIEKELDFIKQRQLTPLAFAVWTLNRHQAESIVKSIIVSPNISYIKIFDPETNFINESGNLKDSYEQEVIYDLIHQGTISKTHRVGTMKLHVTYEHLYEYLINKIVIILISQAIKTFLVSFFILWIVGQIFINDLNKMASFFSKLQFPRDTGKRFKADRAGNKNELDILIDKFNEMTGRLERSYSQIHLWNDGLEEMVAQRMVDIKKLQDKNAHLIRVLCHDMANSSMAISLVEYKLRRICGSVMDVNPLGSDVEKLMKTLRSNSKRQQEILTQVRDAVMSTEEDAIIVSLDTVDVKKLFDEIEQTFLDQLKEKNITLTQKIAPANATIEVDYSIFKNNILSNLISNAIKFSFGGGMIDLIYSEDNFHQAISVVNYGQQISEEGVTAIMSLHKIKSCPGTKGEMGSGIGMMILQKCLQAHDGRLEIIQGTVEKPGVEFKLHLSNHQKISTSDID